MGHYDEYYEMDNRENQKKHENEVYHEFMYKTKDLSIEDKEFFLFILKHIDEFKSFIKLVKTLNKKD